LRGLFAVSSGKTGKAMNRLEGAFFSAFSAFYGACSIYTDGKEDLDE